MKEYDEKTIELFRNLILRDDFKQAINSERALISKLNKSETWYTGRISEFNTMKAMNRFMYKSAELLATQFSLTDAVKSLVQDYLIDNLDLDNLDSQSSYPQMVMHNTVMTFSVGKDFYKEFYLIIQAGATKADILNAVERWWPRMDRYFRKYYPEKYNNVLRVRKRKYRERDSKIIELFKQGIFKTDGNFREQKAKEYLKENGMQIDSRFTEYRKAFLQLGIDLPTTDAIRRVINLYNK